MKIGIVTIMDETNYGNRLQNYALRHFLESRFGCDAVSLVSCEKKNFENGNYILWLKNAVAGQLCRNFRRAEKKWGPALTRWANFRNWSGRHIPTKVFYDHKCLPESLNEEFDFFFAGSDQIWNPRFPGTKFDDFFLEFARDEKKAAISGSFGVESIPEELKKTYGDKLSRFAYLSVREDAGQRIVEDLVGREAPVLVDPAMMLSAQEWERVSKKPRVDTDRPYVLKYYLGDESESDQLHAWAAQKGYAVYELMNPDIPELYAAGPGEFLSLIRNAALVCSDSFHCIVFSILFSRPFVVFARQGEEDYMTSRLTTLLGKFGFEKRWKHLLKPEDYLNCDFSHVAPVLAAEREQFTGYVANVLNKR